MYIPAREMTESTSIHRVAQLYMTADAFHVNLMKSLLRIKYICPNSHTVVWKSFFLELGYHSLFLSLIKYICLNSHNLFFGPFFSSNNSFLFFYSKSYSWKWFWRIRSTSSLLIKHTMLILKKFNISDRLGI